MCFLQNLSNHHTDYQTLSPLHVIELTYAITDRILASFNNDKVLSLGIGINKNITINLEHSSGHSDAKIKYSF
jgi:hypothetical protein